VLLPKATGTDAAEALAVAAGVCGVTLEQLKQHGRKVGVAKGMSVELACRLNGTSQREVSRELGVSEHAVGKQRRRFAEKLRSDPGLAARFRRLSDDLAATNV
jgi:hypothetical protein